MVKRYSDPKQLNLIIRILKRFRYIPKLVFDAKVKIWDKALVAFLLFYLVSPIDLVPETLLGFGIIDDTVFTLISLGLLSDTLDDYIRQDMNNKDPEVIIIHEDDE